MKGLIRTSNALCWGPVINVDVTSAMKSFLKNPREFSLKNTQAEAIYCWGSKGIMIPSNNPKIVKEKYLRTVIGNFLMSALTKEAIYGLEFSREQCECFST